MLASMCPCESVSNRVFDFRIWARLKSMEGGAEYPAAPLAHAGDETNHYVANDESQPTGEASSEGEELLGELVRDNLCTHSNEHKDKMDSLRGHMCSRNAHYSF